jgi:hypothetical protein
MKQILKRWLFSNDIAELHRLIRKAEQLSVSNDFLIKQGVRYCQYQINDTKSKTVPRSLIGHGIQTAANHLNCKSLQWEREWKHEQEKFMKAMTERTGVRSLVNGRIFKPRIMKEEK